MKKILSLLPYNAINLSGALGDMVAYHADMSHMMHGNMGAVGTQRFLPWHRVYLSELEELLQGINPSITIPYWDWTVESEYSYMVTKFYSNCCGERKSYRGD